MDIKDIFSILKESTNRLPQLRFAWGVLGVAAISSLIIRLLGENKASIIVIGLTIIGTILIFVTTIAFGRTAIAEKPAQILVWSITMFFVIFLAFTVSAFAASWPCNWVIFLDISTKDCNVNSRQHEHNTDLNLFDVSTGKTTKYLTINKPVTTPMQYTFGLTRNCKSIIILRIKEKIRSTVIKNNFKFALKKDGTAGSSSIDLISNDKTLERITEIKKGVFFVAKPGTFHFHSENMKLNDAYRLTLQDGSDFTGKYIITVNCT